jgi:hypothetical protein
MTFRKGDTKPETSGRKAGVPNLVTRDIRKGIQMVAEGLGGVPRMLAWCKEDARNEFAFWTGIYVRLMPVQIRGTGPTGELVVQFQQEELPKHLEDRGLPVSIFSRDMPLLELTAVEEKGNGKDRGEGEPGAPVARTAGKGNGGEV